MAAASDLPTRDATTPQLKTHTHTHTLPWSKLCLDHHIISLPFRWELRIRLFFHFFAGEPRRKSRKDATTQTKIKSLRARAKIVLEKACWFCSFANSLLFGVCGFHQRKTSRRSLNSVVPSCLAQKLSPNCFQLDPKVVYKLPGPVVGVRAVLDRFGKSW